MSYFPIAAIFRGPFLRKVCDDKHHQVFTELINLLELEDHPCWGSPAIDFFEYFYDLLLSHYRCEYVFKNAIANNIFLARYSLEKNLISEELMVDSSRADMTIVGESSTVYEIKTEYDDPSRLEGQIADYKKVFDKIYVVVSDEQSERYVSLIDDSVGLLSLANNGRITKIKESESHVATVSLDSVFNCMRKKEYSSALIKSFGEAPDVPTSKYYEACRRKFRRLLPHEAHKLMTDELRSRKLHASHLQLINVVPKSLKMAAIGLRATKSQMLKLQEKLKLPTYEHILPIPERKTIRDVRPARTGKKNSIKQERMPNH